MQKYNYKKIEKKWAEKWVKDKIFTPNLEKAKNPYYSLFMFPYPSAEGLHIGNFYAFTCVDVMAKYKLFQGKDVFEPIGFDAFGMHSENYALKINEIPRKMLNRTMDNFRKQLSLAGIGCDWTREIDTTTPEYYKWTQWIFTKLFEKGLAYQKEALLNWCPSCKTVLADEQIENGVCERCKTVSEKKIMKQWFLKITAYAQRLLDGLNDMDWSKITKHAQKNWIGRSEGASIKFKVQNNQKLEIEIFTTRPDTLFGATYMVLSPEHKLVNKIITEKQKNKAKGYIKKSSAKSDLERVESKDKTGVFTGVYAINPVNNEKIPIWIADYVLVGYGTGAIMAVPAHDERDFEFAKKYNLFIRKVVEEITDQRRQRIEKKEIKNHFQQNKKAIFISEGVNINSDFLNGLETKKAKQEIISWLKKNNFGRKMINYKLRDWCVSRQRYWGPPVPIIYCKKCGIQAVPEKNLPVKLPEMEKGWEPDGHGRGPLAKVDKFINTICPKCGKPSKREPDVMDNFLDSAWYFFRYIDTKNSKEIFNKKISKKWLPVDFYVGGNEHAVLHLMYTRFITIFLHDLGLIDFDNPFKKFKANGMILKDGKKMSKSKGNVLSPEKYGEKIGYDALKIYLLFLGPLNEDRSFNDAGVQGTKRWIEKIFYLEKKINYNYKDNKEVVKKFHKTIKIVTSDFENQKYNTAIARLMEFTNILNGEKNISNIIWGNFLVLIAPFAPALSEELWQSFTKINKNKFKKDKQSIFKQASWPKYDPELAKDEKINLVIQINGKLRDRIEVDFNILEDKAKKIALKSEKIKTWLDNKKIVKIIVVKNKLINIVVV